MLKMFRYLKTVKWHALAILALLVMQAWCDLSLPQYTSDIVDIGIQQGGISRVAPQTVRAATLEDLELFLTEEEAALVDSAYAPEEDGVRKLTLHGTEALDQLDQTLGLPVLMLEAAREKGDMAPGALSEMVAAGQISREQLEAAQQQTAQALSGQSESLIAQRALLFVREEYSAIGVDLNSIQMQYLLLTGGKMLGMSLLMACAAITAGLLASQASARIGMLLRDEVFRKVVSFSSAEIDQFSTASLITRSTNDIQQIQTVMVMLLRIVLYAPIIGIGGILKVVHTHTGMGWIIGVAVGSALAAVAVLMSVAMPKFKSMQRLLDRLNLVSRETLTGVSVIRAFSREAHE